jgi:hypothetical protein
MVALLSTTRTRFIFMAKQIIGELPDPVNEGRDRKKRREDPGTGGVVPARPFLDNSSSFT